VALAEQNLFNRSQEFDDAAWFKTNIAVAANTGETTAPDGTSTAEKLTSNAGSAQHYLQRSTGYVSVINGLTYAFSVFVKAGTETVVQLAAGNAPAFGTNAFVNFDLTAGTTGTVGSAASNASIVAVGNGWYRISFTCPAIANDANGNFLLGFTNNNTTAGRITTFNAAGTEDFYAWGAQLEQRDAVTAYTPTTTAPITNYVPVLLSAADNVARFDHNPVTGESLGLLIEESRTNLLLRSEEFDNASWSKFGGGVTANTIVAPDGTLTGDKFVEDTTTASHTVISASVSITSGTVYTASCYLKMGERRYAQLAGSFNAFGTALWATFDLQLGTVGSVGSGTTATITSVGNGWYRCVVSAAATSTIFGNFVVVNLSTNATTRLPSYTGDGTSGIFIWGAQFEVGAFPTSYIPTVASQVTRAADAASMTGTNFSSWYNQAEGSFYAESSASGTNYFATTFEVNDGSTNNRIRTLRWNDGSDRVGSVSVNGVEQANAFMAGASAAFTKYANAYKINDFASVRNGTTTNVDNSGLIPSASQMFIGSQSANTFVLNGLIRKLAYYPLRVSNTNLVALTN
jgi:hypothetical protein